MTDFAAPRLDAVELWRVALPLVKPFRTSFGTQTTRDINPIDLFATNRTHTIDPYR